MDGTLTWCHFSQRFERSDLQRAAKVQAGGKRVRGYQVCGQAQIGVLTWKYSCLSMDPSNGCLLQAGAEVAESVRDIAMTSMSSVSMLKAAFQCRNHMWMLPSGTPRKWVVIDMGRGCMHAQGASATRFRKRSFHSLTKERT